jgi:hypothetical protein
MVRVKFIETFTCDAIAPVGDSRRTLVVQCLIEHIAILSDTYGDARTGTVSAGLAATRGADRRAVRRRYIHQFYLLAIHYAKLLNIKYFWFR